MWRVCHTETCFVLEAWVKSTFFLFAEKTQASLSEQGCGGA